MSNKWTIAFQGGPDMLSDVRYDTEIVKQGKQSITFTKQNGYMAISMNTGSDMYAKLKNGFSYWIYVDLAEQPMINTTDTKNFIGGDNQKYAALTENIPNKTWVKITVSAAEINASGRFLIIQGSTAGTYYIDGIEPLATQAE